jgi:RecA-family ATPase
MKRELATPEDVLKISEIGDDGVKPLKALTGLDVYNSEFKEPEPIIESLLYNGLTIFASRPKVGKSWFALQIAIAIANGTTLARRLSVRKPGRVLYIALEETQRRTAPRLRRLTDSTENLERIDFVYSIDPLLAGGAEQIRSRLNEQAYVLVIVDTFYAFAKQAERKNVDILQADYNQINTLREICEACGCALLLIHHARKAPGNGVDVVLGTSGVTAACDHIWVLERRKEGDCLLTVTSREIEEQIFAMKLVNDDPFGWTITGRGADAELSVQRQAICDFLAKAGPSQPKDIARALGKNGSTVRRLLQKLVADDIVKKEGENYLLSRARE